MKAIKYTRHESILATLLSYLNGAPSESCRAWSEQRGMTLSIVPLENCGREVLELRGAPSDYACALEGESGERAVIVQLQQGGPLSENMARYVARWLQEHGARVIVANALHLGLCTAWKQPKALMDSARLTACKVCGMVRRGECGRKELRARMLWRLDAAEAVAELYPALFGDELRRNIAEARALLTAEDAGRQARRRKREHEKKREEVMQTYARKNA